jgi:glycosyltransferase involved in cell wall biosynthesis
MATQSMRVCMVLHDPQEFGGLEEYVTSLAIGLQDLGHAVSVLSDTWLPDGNQYFDRLRARGVEVVQPPLWLSRPASHWPTKQRILEALVGLAAPLVAVLALGRMLAKGGGWRGSFTSARNWLRGGLLARLVGEDRRKPLARWLLGRWTRRWKPDVLHLHGYTSNLLFAIEWAHDRRIPVVYEEHQTPDARFDWWRDFPAIVNKAAVVVAVSDTSAASLRSVCGVTRPIAVRKPLLPDPVPGGLRRVARRPGERMRSVTVARLYVTKGLEYLLEAAALVARTHPHVEFKVHGEGPIRQALVDRAAELGLDGEAIFAGAFTSRDELTAIMSEADLFVMSSVLEGQPLGLVEAMAYGCPVVATTVGGIPELIADGENGLLCEPRDAAALAAAIRQLADDPPLRARLGDAARRSYERGGFTQPSVCSHLASVYAQAVAAVDAALPPGAGEVVGVS